MSFLLTDDVVAMLDRRNAELTALRAEVAKLHKALRRTAFTDTEGTRFCRVCGWVWEASQPELHAPGCLAAPKETDHE